ncbi:response regulator transcription factor [Priestia megaterium]|uniref:Response regulator n=1 Tax=Priestia megaterium TaxID=1404 RepID=A0A6M6E4U0_PRIMG|nr:response regulator [Priestia megaterium]QJX80584.1 response regulator [Priestia megaterium]
MYPKILICDDVVYSRTLLKNILDQIGQFIIVEVENGKDLIKELEKSQQKNSSYNYLFLDLEMRREDGIALLREVRGIAPSLEVILSGGVSLTDENIKTGIDLGVKRFVAKPYKARNVRTIFKSM